MRYNIYKTAPLVAGIVANILANKPDFEFDDIKNRSLEYAVYDVNDGYGNTKAMLRTDKSRVECIAKCYGKSSMVQPKNSGSKQSLYKILMIG